MQAPETSLRRTFPVDDPQTSDAGAALGRREYGTVLALTSELRGVPEEAWLDYDRAAALAALGRTEAAVRGYLQAEIHFLQLGDGGGVADSRWGRATTLADAGRCDEARIAYSEFEKLVRPTDPAAADAAAQRVWACQPR